MNNNIIKSLLTGCVAGIIDVIPMLIQRSGMFAYLSAFSHWLVLALIIPYLKWEMSSWLKGGVIGFISAIPIVLMIVENDANSVIPILLISSIIGIGVGFLSGKFIIIENK